MVVDDRIISASSQAIKGADDWGVTGVTVFFVIVILFIVGFFIWFVVRELKRSVDGNTTAIKESVETSKEIAKTMSFQNEQRKADMELTHKISRKQDEIHSDVKEILHATRYKFGLGDYDMSKYNIGKKE